MSPVHLHLLLNHLPILGIPFGLALLVYGVLRHQQEIQKLALAAFVLCGLALVPVYLTGEPGEEAVEDLPGVSERVIEEHEDSGKLSLVVVEALAAGSLLGLAAYRRHPLPGGVVVGVLLLGLLSSGSLAYTGYLGGQIRHTEIRAGEAGPASGGESAGARQGGEHELEERGR